MSKRRGKKVAVFPGTFDPITNGHVDIIQRCRPFFDELIIGVGRNPEKDALFTPAERVKMVKELTRDMDNVSVESYDSLTVEFVKRKGAQVIVRGIRDNVDLRGEIGVANTNLLVGGIETMFLMTTDQHALTSSTLIKLVIDFGGYDPEGLKRLVPHNVIERLRAKIDSKKRRGGKVRRAGARRPAR